MSKKYTIYDGENDYNLIENATASEAGWAWATQDGDEFRLERNEDGEYFEAFCRLNGTSHWFNTNSALISSTEEEAKIELGEQFLKNLKKNQGRFSVIEAE